MSSAAEEGGAVEADICCANCGAAEIDDVKLEECGGCDLVKYCSDGCRELHRPEHVGECKRRAKELHNRKLFTQPDETHLGECPLCFLPLPIDPQKSAFLSCCSETVCNGCVDAHCMANKHDRVKAERCPFCREPGASGNKEIRKRLMKRVKANDPDALRHLGLELFIEGDYDGAFKQLTRAAELGDFTAHYQLGLMYEAGKGVEKDEKKRVHHLEEAAIGGHPQARHALACYEGRNGNIKRAAKHFIIAANLGYEQSMKALWWHYSDGSITKEDLDATLRTHQDAIKSMKSEQREAADRAK